MWWLFVLYLVIGFGVATWASLSFEEDDRELAFILSMVLLWPLWLILYLVVVMTKGRWPSDQA